MAPYVALQDGAERDAEEHPEHRESDSAVTLFLWMGRPAAAAPALWVVQSPAGKVYLFGTVHLLRDGTQWQSPELAAAIAQSQDLYLEIADPANLAGMSSVFKIGFDREHPLSTKISKEDVGLLDVAAKRYGYGTEAFFEPMEPWLVFLMLSMMPATHSGYSPSNGVDVLVRKQFVDAGKPVRGLETADMQLHLFADMPQTEQVALLDSALKGVAPRAGAPGLDAIVDAWMSGDVDRLATMLQADSFPKSDFGDRLLTKRNAAWATFLAQRLKQPGTSFVSVGALHLIGSGGVPALLAKMGFTVTRVPIAQVASTPVPQASPAASSPASPAPTASPTPIPQTIVPPEGWVKKATTFDVGGFKAEMMWVDPRGGAAIVTGHLVVGAAATPDLDAIATLLHEGMVAESGEQNVAPNKRVKICGGKQDGVLTSVTLGKALEETAIGVSDRPYLAEYVRRPGAPEDPAAVRSILSLCAP
jgi:uncharacterized protein YbaP (TraB family)